jgi:hypothetical protein
VKKVKNFVAASSYLIGEEAVNLYISSAIIFG